MMMMIMISCADGDAKISCGYNLQHDDDDEYSEDECTMVVMNMVYLLSCADGDAKISCGYNLPARFVISTVGPRWITIIILIIVIIVIITII